MGIEYVVEQLERLPDNNPETRRQIKILLQKLSPISELEEPSRLEVAQKMGIIPLKKLTKKGCLVFIKPRIDSKTEPDIQRTLETLIDLNILGALLTEKKREESSLPEDISPRNALRLISHFYGHASEASFYIARLNIRHRETNLRFVRKSFPYEEKSAHFCELLIPEEHIKPYPETYSLAGIPRDVNYLLNSYRELQKRAIILYRELKENTWIEKYLEYSQKELPFLLGKERTRKEEELHEVEARSS